MNKIKYARGVNPNPNYGTKNLVKDKAERQGSTYSGASWNGQVGPRSASHPFSIRAATRSQNGGKGKRNLLLGACKSRTNATRHLMHPVGMSIHSSKPQNRIGMKKLQEQWENQQNEEAENDHVNNAEGV